MTASTCPPPCFHRGRLRRAAALLLAGWLIVVAHPAPAAAHGGEGVLSLDQLTPVGDPGAGRWSVGVLLSSAEDGHPADGATVSVAGQDDDGDLLTPVPLVATGGGHYAATVELPGPGTWNLRVVSVEPPALLSLEPLTVAAPSSTVVAPPTAATGATTTTPVGDGSGAAASGTDRGEERSDRRWLPAALAALAALAGVGLVAWFAAVRSRARPGRGASRQR